MSAATATNIAVFPGGTGTSENGQTAKSSSPTTSLVGDHTHGVGMSEAGAHSHAVSVNSSSSHTHTVSIGSSGGGKAHNNMPPYLVAYIWKRVA